MTNPTPQTKPVKSKPVKVGLQPPPPQSDWEEIIEKAWSYAGSCSYSYFHEILSSALTKAREEWVDSLKNKLLGMRLTKYSLRDMKNIPTNASDLLLGQNALLDEIIEFISLPTHQK